MLFDFIFKSTSGFGSLAFFFARYPTNDKVSVCLHKAFFASIALLSRNSGVIQRDFVVD